jgi:heme/copper-type cytochrome/quinol oxidase subunit 2
MMLSFVFVITTILFVKYIRSPKSFSIIPKSNLLPNSKLNSLPATTAIPPNSNVLEPGDTAADGDTAIPASVYPEERDAYGKRRLFEVKAVGNRFSPSKIVVNQDDIVTIKFVSADKTYDFTLPGFGIKQTITPDNLRFAEFQANIEGAFPIYCAICDGGKATSKGIIVVISNGKIQSLTNIQTVL